MFERVTQGPGETIVPNQDLETWSVDTYKTLFERADDLFYDSDAKAIENGVVCP